MNNVYNLLYIYTQIFQLCNMSAFSIYNTSQKANILHIWMYFIYIYAFVYVYIIYTHTHPLCLHGLHPIACVRLSSKFGTKLSRCPSTWSLQITSPSPSSKRNIPHPLAPSYRYGEDGDTMMRRCHTVGSSRTEPHVRYDWIPFARTPTPTSADLRADTHRPRPR